MQLSPSFHEGLMALHRNTAEQKNKNQLQIKPLKIKVNFWNRGP